VILLGAVVLLGWSLDSQWLKSGIPKGIAMNPGSAVLFIIGGFALGKSVNSKIETSSRDWVVVLCGLILTAGGALKLAEYLFSFDSNLDQLLFRTSLGPVGSLPANEIAPNTAFNFLFCGIGLLTIDAETQRGFRPAQLCFLLAGLVALLALIGYAYRVLPLYSLGSATPMALSTAVAFGLFALAGLAVRPDRGIMMALTSDTTAGAIARRLLPAAILIPLGLGALRFTSERRGLFEVEFGVSLFAVANMVLFTCLIWWNAQLLFRAEQQRLRAERRLAVQYAATRVLAESTHVAEATDKLVRVICESLGWQVGALWEMDESTGQIHCQKMHTSLPGMNRFAEVSRKLTFAIGSGLPGRVWRSREPVWIEDLSANGRLHRGPVASEVGLHSACGFPIRFNGTVCGVMEFFSTGREPADDSLLQMFAAIGSQTGQFIERKFAENQLKQASVDLERSNTDLQQFAYVASHDLSEPLRMIVSYLQLLGERHEKSLNPEAREFIGYAVDGAQRMQRLIQDLLAYARVGSHGRDFQMTDCEQVLGAVLQNLKLTIAETGAVIERQPLPTVKGDPIQLTQVFQNLISNAIKFRGNKAPRIGINARREGREWVFAVQDNGIGIEPRNFERIFVLFQRLHTRQEYPGTGIGLAICKRIIERHGGRIWAESTPGQGTAFNFTLPAVED
jgi:signal transduction histidine kinase